MVIISSTEDRIQACYVSAQAAPRTSARRKFQGVERYRPRASLYPVSDDEVMAPFAITIGTGQ
jgi:hypothetical protein